jgi:carboxyl-terminal processing protease
MVTLSVTLLLSSNLFKDKSPKREKLLSHIIHTGLERWHYSGKKIDDEFSKHAFEEFLEYLDYGKRFLLLDDVRALRKYSDKIDDQFAAGSTEMMSAAVSSLEKRIQQVMAFYSQFLDKPFDFNQPETLEFDMEKRAYCKNLEELKDYWRKYLKYRTLTRYIAFVKSRNKKAGKEKTDTPIDYSRMDMELEKKARDAVRKSFKSYFDRLRQGIRNDSMSRYINSLLQVYDPHTVYFPPVDKETFDMSMSGSFEGIGALLNQDEEYVAVARLIPGGPSWRGKQLGAGDQILKVAQGKNEPVDIIGMRVQDAVKLIRGKKGTTVRLTVKKPDGQITEIPIVRDVVVLEETFARSAVLVNKTSGKRFGYIHLPGFYNDFARMDGRNATTDVKKELEALKKKGVDGIILDLRNNGGGALRDAVRMSGLFIPEGPVVQVKDKDSQIKVLDDPDPGVTYDGPLVVMVNTFSASASEILAAALQDYKRAVIIGGTHSYGKGTVQAMLNLDRFVSKRPDNKKGFGALTITIQQFYRISGNSIQLKGVTPDIVLPDRHDSFEIGERHLDYSLSWDAVPPASYRKWRSHSLVNDSTIARSKARVRQSPAFQRVIDYVRSVKAMRDDTMQSLQLGEVVKRQEQIKKERDKLTQFEKELLHVQVTQSRQLKKKNDRQLDKIAQERRQEWFKEIKKDLMLGEVVRIMSDMLRGSGSG